MDASEIYSKRLNAKEVIFPKEGEFIFPIADGRIKTLGGDQELRTSTLVRHRPIQGESNIDFLGESEGSVKLKEKQKWSNEKLHLDNARKLRGIYFIDPEDKEFKETIKNTRKKLETSVALAMPCKIMKNCWSGASNKIKTKLACILEADESTMRMGESLPNHHEDHIAVKGNHSFHVRDQVYNTCCCEFLVWSAFLSLVWHMHDVCLLHGHVAHSSHYG